jgi:putative hydrolase of the HAD superfamily
MKALLLDFGSVISKSLFERQEMIEEKLNLPKGILTWKGPFSPETDALWMAMQRDEITERAYWGTRAKEIGELIGEDNWDMSKLLQAIGGERIYDKVLRPQALKTIAICKQNGIKVGILSNEIELFTGKEWVENLPFIHDLDSFYDATHSDILKPDPRAYQIALQQLDVAPNEVLFVDDQLRNIVGAMKCGLKTLHFDITEPDACYEYVLRVLLPHFLPHKVHKEISHKGI